MEEDEAVSLACRASLSKKKKKKSKNQVQHVSVGWAKL